MADSSSISRHLIRQLPASLQAEGRLRNNLHGLLWLKRLRDLQRDPKTLRSYAYALDDWLGFLAKHKIAVDSADESTCGSYVADMRRRKAGSVVRTITAGSGLANATMRVRLTVVRQFYEFLKRRIPDVVQPAPAGARSLRQPSQGKRGILPVYERMPWIPSDTQFHRFLELTKSKSLRTRAMVAVAYDAALRAETVVGLNVDDIDFANGTLRIRAEIVKGHREGVLGFSSVTSDLLATYVNGQRTRIRRRRSGPPCALFVSESNQNRDRRMTADGWNDIVKRIAREAALPGLHPHTLRHLRLTHMARGGMELMEVMQWAMHRNPQTTTRYIHLAGKHLNQRVASVQGRLSALAEQRSSEQ